MIYLVTKDKSKFSNLYSDQITFGEIDDVLFYFQDKDEIAFDTETTGFDAMVCNLISAQFGDEANQFVVDSSTIPITEFKSLLESKKLLIQNAKFDLKFLYVQNIWPERVYDTFLAETVLNMGRKNIRRSLDELAKRYCNIYLDKTVRGVIHREGLSQKVIKYAADDVKYLHAIRDAQMIKIREQGLAIALDLENQFVIVLTYMELCGFKVDVVKWAAKMEQDQLIQLEAEKALNNWIFSNNKTKYISAQMDLFNSDKVCTINWSSSKQVIKLFKELGINVLVKDSETGEMKESVDAKVLAPQSKKFDIIPLYTEYQQASKVVSTYGKSVLKQIHRKTGRLHTQFTQLMSTGRMSSGGKDKENKIEYVNFQNIPATPEEKDRIPGKIYERQCFIPEEGNVLVVSDFSGQESVLFANFCKDPKIIAFYENGHADMHSYIASQIFPELQGLSLKEIKDKHKDKRQIAKSAGLIENFTDSSCF